MSPSNIAFLLTGQGLQEPNFKITKVNPFSVRGEANDHFSEVTVAFFEKLCTHTAAEGTFSSTSAFSSSKGAVVCLLASLANCHTLFGLSMAIWMKP